MEQSLNEIFSKQQIPPVRLWGLNPLHRCSIKLFIKQLLQIPQVPSFAGVYMLYTHPVSRFEVVGCIISIQRKEQFIKFGVDDGSGVIQCCVWLSNIPFKEELFTFKLGDLVSVSGKLNIFREEREINVVRITLETDPNFESFHWMEVMNLHKKVYREKFVLPREFCKET